jgi:hypothetical protein
MLDFLPFTILGETWGMSRFAYRPQNLVLVIGCLLWGTADVAEAQTPSITNLRPLAVRPGESTDLKLQGANLDGAAQLWTSFSGQAELSPDVADNGKNKGECVYRVAVPTDAGLGIHAVRVSTARGVSGMKLLLVDDLPTVVQDGSNTSESAAQELVLPCAVDGAVANLSRNFYKFRAEAGSQLSFEVFASRLGSPLDPMIRLLDSQGRELTYSDDTPGLNSDSQICYTFETAGEYLLEIRDIRYQGSGNHVYRLRIGDFPCVHVPFPMGVQRGVETEVGFAGAAGANLQPVKVHVPADSQQQWQHVAARRVDGESRGFTTVRLTDSEEFIETEPNNTAEQANRVSLGANLNGRIDEPGDIDRFVFAAKKGQKYSFVGVTRRQGAPTALSMRLLKPDGGQVGAVQDFGITDSVINYTFPEDGDYTLEVADLHRRGGPQFAYHVLVEPIVPSFTLEASEANLNVPAGGVLMLTVTAARSDYNGPIAIEAAGLPEGITSTPTVMGPGQNSVVLTLQGMGEVTPGDIYSVRIVGSAQIGDRDIRAEASIGNAIKQTMTGAAWPPVALTEYSAAAIAPAAAFRLKTEPAEVVFGRDLSATVKVTVERGENIDEAITLAVTPDQGGLPNGVTAAVKPIAKDTNEIEIVFSANDKAALGDFTAVLTGTHKKGNATVVQPAPGILYKLQQPFALGVDVGDGKLAPGGQLKVKVTAERNPAFNGPIAISFQNLPKGVTAETASIPEGADEVEVQLSAAEDAEQGAVKNLTAKGDAEAGKAKLTGTSAAVQITVE